jgi:hypothetical protein
MIGLNLDLNNEPEDKTQISQNDFKTFKNKNISHNFDSTNNNFNYL